ncbi:MAG TPA: hypothetical protein VK168_17245 [Saprospiraceae bacterium]|nr:hypothetical protein [Saprospiraceae bacterium]
MKYLHISLFVYLIYGCAKKEVHLDVSTKKIEASQIAIHYLKSIGCSAELIGSLTVDTIYSVSATLVLFNINGRKEPNSNWNMLPILLHPDQTIDTTFYQPNVEKLEKHRNAPDSFPMFLNRSGATTLAQRHRLEPGIKPWKIHPAWSSNHVQDLTWIIQNTIQESTNGAYRASGKQLIINAINGEAETQFWQQIE